MQKFVQNIFDLDYTDEQIKNLALNAKTSAIILNILSAVFMAVVFFSVAPYILLFVWLVLNFLLAVARISVGKRLVNSLEVNYPQEIRLYFKQYLFVVLLSGVIWGGLIFYAISNLSDDYAFFTLTLMFALTTGSMVTLGSVFLALFLFVSSVSIPALIAFTLNQYNFLRVMEIILILINLIVLLGVAYKKKKLILKNIESLDLLSQYQQIANKSAIISKTDKRGIITYANENFCNISGYSKEELIGKPHNIVRHPDMPREVFKEMWGTIKNKKETWQGVIKNLAKNGDPYYVSSTISPIIDKNGDIKEFIALRYNITDIMSDKKQLFDFLSINKLSVLVMVQIEEYSVIEKFYDKATLSELERIFADALVYLMPSTCGFQKVYNLGGGLYAFAKDRRSCRATKNELEAMLKEFLENVEKYSVDIGEAQYDISVVCSFSFGVIQLYEDVKLGIEKAINEKQHLVYADGLSGYEYQDALENIKMLKDIKTAIDDKKVISYFQPIVNNKTMEVAKYESLVRIIDKNGQIIPPMQFMEVAKKGRYYLKVTKIVLENSFDALDKIKEDISINLSVLDIESKDIQVLIMQYLKRYANNTRRVVFELLESEEVKDFEKVIQFIKKIKSKGVKIAIDDFGSGYSNFERLLKYEPDYIKIDGSLIKDIDKSELSRNIVETIAIFAKKQGIEIIAEYVENSDIFDIVKNMGIEYSQGYFFGKPGEIA